MPPPNYRPDFGTGYRISFDEFRSLIRDPLYQPPIRALLHKWYGYEIVGIEDEAIVRSPTGVSVDERELYETIQSDPKKQYDLYQSAIALWR
jgi:hypothetical protein